jgi:hypothetical protein
MPGFSWANNEAEGERPRTNPPTMATRGNVFIGTSGKYIDGGKQRRKCKIVLCHAGEVARY